MSPTPPDDHRGRFIDHHENMDSEQRARRQREESGFRLSESQAKEIATAAAEEAVAKMFDRLGHDVTKTETVNELRRDWDYTRRSRVAAEGRRNSAANTIITGSIGAAIAAGVGYLSNLFARGGH